MIRCAHRLSLIIGALLLMFGGAVRASTLSEVIVANVATGSFDVIYRDVEPMTVSLQVFDDVLATQPSAGILINNAYSVSNSAALATTLRDNALARIRVSGLLPDRAYFFQLIVTPVGGGADRFIPASAPLPSVQTMLRVQPQNNSLIGVRVQDTGGLPVDGSIILLHANGQPYPLSHISGDSYGSGFAALQLSNLVNPQAGENLAIGDGAQLDLVAQGGAAGSANTTEVLAAGENIGETWIPSSSPLLLTAFLDSDGDGMPDDFELLHGLDPNIDDGGGDLDSDGLSNLEEYSAGTDPNVVDSDGDGLSDGDEINIFGTLPTQFDSDQDGLSDGDEVNSTGSDPLDSDSDNDGANDGTEIEQGTDPNDDTSTPFFDLDGDGIADSVDNCPARANPAQTDSDFDTVGDECDADDDNDGIPDELDNAPRNFNPSQTDTDDDGVGDAGDNCNQVYNPDQINSDLDAQGDACDVDDDNDGVFDFAGVVPSNAWAKIVLTVTEVTATTVPFQPNNSAIVWFYKYDEPNNALIRLGSFNLGTRVWEQEVLSPTEQNLKGPLVYAAGSCDCIVFGPGLSITVATDDGDVRIVLPQSSELPPLTSLWVSFDGSSFGGRFIGSDPVRLGNHVAAGVMPAPLDNCRITANPDQSDIDGDGKGDVCDSTADDIDGDDVPNVDDNCPAISNTSQSDIDGDGQGDVCDLDADGDGISNLVELGTLGTNPLAADSNNDGIDDANEDFDFDGISNADELARGLSPDAPDTDLQPGLNLVHFPVEVPVDYSAFDLLADLGGDGVVSRVERIDPASEQVMAAFYVGGLATGDDFQITPVAAYMVTMLQARTQSWGGKALCLAVQFDQGKQLIGFGCVPKGLTSKQLLQSLGATSITALQSFNVQSGRFEAAGFDQGVPAGDDYLLTGVDGYLAHLQAITITELFNLRPPVVIFDNLVDGQDVYDSELPISGIIGDANAHITVNGETLSTLEENGGTLFGGTISLVEGINVITIRVRGADNQLIELTYTINYLPPPDIQLLSHFDGQVTHSSLTILMGSVSSDAATVTLDGIELPISNGEFRIDGVKLLEGENTFLFETIGTNGGIRTLPISITSTPIFMTLTTPSATVPGSGTGKKFGFFDFPVPQSIYDEASIWGGIGIVFPSFIGIAPGTSWQKFAPNIFRQSFAFLTDEDTTDIGEHDLIYEYRYRNSSNQQLWSEQIRYRIAIVDERNIVLVFDEPYDGLIVSDPVLRIQGRVLGSADSVTINGVEAVLGSQGSGLGIVAFSLDVQLQPGENYLDVVAGNALGTDSSEIMVVYEPNNGLDILISSHQSQSAVSSATVDIAGSVSTGIAAVAVNGVPASVTPNPDGSALFSATIPLLPGLNDVRATANIGSQSAGSAIRLTRAAFDLRLDNVVDRGTIRTNRPALTGTASETLQSVLVNGVSQTVNGSAFSIVFGQAGLAFLAPFEFTTLHVEATSVAGDTVFIDVSVRYEPFSFVRNDPSETEIEFELEIAEPLVPTITDWRIRWLQAPRLPFSLISGPSEGLIVRIPGFDHLGGGILRLRAQLELHGYGDPFFSEFVSYYIDLLDADGGIIETQEVKTNWKLFPASTSHLFITSLHDGMLVDHSPIAVVGRLRNINANSLTVNGEAIIIEDDWGTEVDLVEGDNSLTVEAVDVDGTVYTKALTVILAPPTRIDVTENMGNRRIDLLVFQKEPSAPVWDFFDTPRPYWLNFTDPDNVYTSTIYYNGIGTIRYYNSRIEPVITTASLTDSEDYGIWELSYRTRGFGIVPEVNRTFMFWINVLDPSLAAGPIVVPTSHTDGESVATDSVNYTVEVTNDPFARVEINGQLVAPTNTRRVVTTFGEIRIDVEYTTDIQLVPGANVIEVRAVSDNGTEVTTNFTLNR